MTDNGTEKKAAGMDETGAAGRADGADSGRRSPGVKICGITTMKEADWVNAAGADYAGFVFYERSRRNVSMMDAVMIKKSLYPSVKSVAVTVSPTVELLRQIEIGGFDIIQVHGELSPDVLRECRIPVWRAFNIGRLAQADAVEECGQPGEREAGADARCGYEMESGAEHGLPGMPEEREEERAQRERLEDALIEAYVLDGAAFGGGKTFDWADGRLAGQLRALFGEKKLVLAGGLNVKNVSEGIRLFAPDIVDVSSGVERDYGSGKDEEKIYQFVRKVREG